MTEGVRPTDEFVACARDIANTFLDKAEERGDVPDPHLRSAVNAGDLTFEQQVRNEVQGVEIFAAGVAVAWASRLEFPPGVWIDDAD
jgi:class 3 adenylate cyclase